MQNQDPKLLSTFGVVELQPGSADHHTLIDKLTRIRARQGDTPIEPLPTDRTLTLVVLPDMPAMTLGQDRWSRLRETFDPIFEGQYCLSTGGEPSILAFQDKAGGLSGLQRVHLFAHWTLRLINQAGVSILDNHGEAVIDRFVRYSPDSFAIVYFGRQTDRGSFVETILRYWVNFNGHLLEEEPLLASQSAATGGGCDCHKAAS